MEAVLFYPKMCSVPHAYTLKSLPLYSSLCLITMPCTPCPISQAHPSSSHSIFHAVYPMLWMLYPISHALYPMPVPTTPHPCPCPRLTAALPLQVKQELPPPSPSSQGMLDRSRMALCTFVFLCLSFNPLASLLQGSGSPAPLVSQDTGGPGRSIMADSGSLGKLWCGTLGWRLLGWVWDGGCQGGRGLQAVEVKIIKVQDVGVGVG